MAEENIQNIKSPEDIDNELEIAGNVADFTPDEEEFPEIVNNILSEEPEDEELQEGEKVSNKDKKLNKRRIGQKGYPTSGEINQEKTDEKTYKENVKHVTEKNYASSNETSEKKSDKDEIIQDSKLNPVTETQFQAPDPDEPKKNRKSGVDNKHELSKKMRNKNQPL